MFTNRMIKVAPFTIAIASSLVTVTAFAGFAFAATKDVSNNAITNPMVHSGETAA